MLGQLGQFLERLRTAFQGTAPQMAFDGRQPDTPEIAAPAAQELHTSGPASWPTLRTDAPVGIENGFFSELQTTEHSESPFELPSPANERITTEGRRGVKGSSDRSLTNSGEAGVVTTCSLRNSGSTYLGAKRLGPPVPDGLLKMDSRSHEFRRA